MNTIELYIRKLYWPTHYSETFPLKHILLIGKNNTVFQIELFEIILYSFLEGNGITV